MVSSNSYAGLIFLLLMPGLDCAVSAAMYRGNESNGNSKRLSRADIPSLLSTNSPADIVAKTCIDIALSEFYMVHSDYCSRLVLHANNMKGVNGAASSALEFLTKEERKAISAPQRSNEASFVVEPRGKAHVPIISYSVSSSSISPSRSPYSTRSVSAETSQLQAIIAIIKGFQWHEVIFLYDDSEPENGFVPRLKDAFREADVWLPYMSGFSPSAEDFEILKELKKLTTMQTTVFLVHMTPFLASKLFVLAKKFGMMTEGYVWIITDKVASSLSSLDATSIESMEGVLGIRPFIPKSKDLDIFKQKFQFLQHDSFTHVPNILGSRAYDTALAMAAERTAQMNSGFVKDRNDSDVSDLENIEVSEVGGQILNEISQALLKGLGSEFQFVNGQLQTSVFEILNILGNGERIIGYWTLDGGITGEFGSRKRLKKIIWPGDSLITPKGSAIPTFSKSLKACSLNR